MEPHDGLAVCPGCGRREDGAAIAPLFVVTGASGSGKTTVYAPLARLLAGRCVTFDADLLMDAAGELSGDRPIRWPAFRAAWLAAAHGVAQSGLATVLLGPFIPSQLDELPARRWVGPVRFLVLDRPDDLRRERMQARPGWRSRDITEQTEFGRWSRVHIPERVDTPPQDAATAVAAWVTGQLTALA